MNKLPREARAKILHLLCEGNSIRAVTRITGASKTTVTKLVVDAGQAAAWYQDRVFRNIECKRLQVDEIWGFVGGKQRNVKPEKKEAGEAGNIWVWVATDAVDDSPDRCRSDERRKQYGGVLRGEYRLVLQAARVARPCRPQYEPHRGAVVQAGRRRRNGRCKR